MKRREVPWERLFRAARSAPAEPDGAMPGYLQNRILAHWRGAAGPEDGWPTLALVFRGALVCASLAMVLSIAWSYADLSQDLDEDEAIVSYELRADLLP